MVGEQCDVAPHIFTRGVGTAKERVTRYTVWVVENFASYRADWLPCRVYGKKLSDTGTALLRGTKRVWNVPNWKTFEIFAAVDRGTAYDFAADLARNNHGEKYRIVPYNYDQIEPLGIDPVTQEPASADESAAPV